jgi:hypothetical protein
VPAGAVGRGGVRVGGSVGGLAAGSGVPWGAGVAVAAGSGGGAVGGRFAPRGVPGGVGTTVGVAGARVRVGVAGGGLAGARVGGTGVARA